LLHYYRIGSLLSVGRVEEARAAAAAQIRDTPLGATYTLALLSRNFGDLDWAEQILRQCESVLRPGDLFCRRVLIEILVSEGRIEEAGSLVSSWLSVSKGVGDGEMLQALASGTITQQDLNRVEAAVGARHAAALRTRMAELGFPSVRPLPVVVTPDARAGLPIEWGNVGCIVRARINNKHNVRLMVDTGASVTMLNRRHLATLLADAEVKRKAVGTQPRRLRSIGIAGIDTPTEIEPLRLGVGILRLTADPVLEAPHPFERNVWLSGVLGLQVLHRCRITLDYHNRIVTFWTPSDFIPPEYRVPQPAVRLMNNLAARLGDPQLPNQRLVR
jgi:hypothetical protein